MGKSKISGILSMMICLAALQSCHKEAMDADAYVEESSSSRKRIKPIVVEVGEDEVLQDIGEVPVAAVVETPVVASTVAPAVVADPGMTPIDGAGLPFGTLPPPIFPIPVPPIGGGFDEERDDCELASSGFAVTDPAQWYVINTSSYPTTVPLSLNGNRGFDEGDITVTDTGITINRSGDYWVNMTAIVSYIVPDPQILAPIPAVGSEFIIPVYVARDGDFDPAGEDPFGGIGIFPLNETHIEDIQANGIMANVKKGTELTIVATNSGTSGDEPIPLTVIGWNISLHRLCN